VFGDPWPGVRKICQCKSNGGGSGQEMTFTAKQLRQCSKDDVHQIIPDYGRASASTVWGNHHMGYGCGSGRLDSNQAWSARYNRKDEWWQFDVGDMTNIAGVRTMRRKNNGQRVMTYAVLVNSNGRNGWTNVDNSKVFNGNVANTETVVENLFNAPVRGQFVRWVVKTWQYHISGRFAVMSCAGHFSSDAEAERLNNGGFEVGTQYGMPTSWQRYARYGNTGQAWPDQSHSGKRSVKFWGGGWQLIENGPHASDSITLVKDKHYTFTLWMRTTAKGQRTRVEFLNYNKGGQVQKSSQGVTKMMIYGRMSERQCAGEGGTCKCNGKVRYGEGSRWSTKCSGQSPCVVKGSIRCVNSVFGDPWPGKRKRCLCTSADGYSTTTTGVPPRWPTLGRNARSH